MGSLRAFVMLASFAACETSGVEVVVLPPTEGEMPDQIRLFIGMPEETEASIAPEEFTRAQVRKGNVWVRDPMNGDVDLVRVARGDQVVFGFVPQGGGSQELGAVIAVGYSGGVPTSAGSLFHVRTGDGNVQVFELQLHPAVDPRDEANRMAPVQLEIWGPNPGDETCVHLVNAHADSEHLHRTAFIVSHDDRDCDGRASPGDPLECTGDVHDGTRPPSRSDLSCSTYTTSSVGAGAFCVLGGPSCTDGTDRVDSECSPSRFCASPLLCTTCRASNDPWACVTNPIHDLAASPTALGIKCHVPSSGEPVDDMSPIELCSEPMRVTIPMPATLTAPGCSRAMVRTLMEPFADHLTIAGMRFGVAVDGACELTLTPTGGFLAGDFPARSGGLVTIDLANGRGLALPLHLVFDQPTSGCEPSPIGCVIIGDAIDRPMDCLLSPPP